VARFIEVKDGHASGKRTDRPVQFVELGWDQQIAALFEGKIDIIMSGGNIKLGIAVCLKEGCSVESLQTAKIFVHSPMDAVGLMLSHMGLVASLRR